MAYRHSHRLPEEFYLGRTVAFTACLSPRLPLLNSPAMATPLQEFLVKSAAYYSCDLLVFLFMPDHLHAVIASRDSTSDPLSAMKRFKQVSGFWFSQNNVRACWQKDFYDHILRNHEDLPKHIRYILNNPVRAGICENWKQYPFKGSTVADLEQWDALL